jgi:hypothetical protein
MGNELPLLELIKQPILQENQMRHVILMAAAISLTATMAWAQEPAAQNGPQNPAIKSMDKNNSSVPVACANSFTRGEAIKQIEAKGYTHVAGLKKDKSGVWRGTAMKDGHKGKVSVDYQGNVN